MNMYTLFAYFFGGKRACLCCTWWCTSGGVEHGHPHSCAPQIGETRDFWKMILLRVVVVAWHKATRQKGTVFFFFTKSKQRWKILKKILENCE